MPEHDEVTFFYKRFHNHHPNLLIKKNDCPFPFWEILQDALIAIGVTIFLMVSLTLKIH